MTTVDCRLQIYLYHRHFSVNVLRYDPSREIRGESRPNYYQAVWLRFFVSVHEAVDSFLSIVVLTVGLVKEHAMGLHRFATLLASRHETVILLVMIVSCIPRSIRESLVLGLGGCSIELF